MFQLTTSRRGRRFPCYIIGVWGKFQLTTSRRGRLTTWIHSWHLDCFNSRPHEEVDVSFAGYRSAASGVSTHDLTKRSTLSMRQSVMRLTFQLTTSRRGRLLHRPYRQLLTRFNSRPHEEVDTAKDSAVQIPIVSTHDLTKRSTKCKPCWT